MSLGLNDLKKPVRTSKTETKIATGSGAVSEDWALPAKAARPWTKNNLVPKAQKNDQARSNFSSAVGSADASMNLDWANDHTSSIAAFDMEAQSVSGQVRDLQISLREQAVEIERKIKRAVKSPFQIMRAVFSFVRK